MNKIEELHSLWRKTYEEYDAAQYGTKKYRELKKKCLELSKEIDKLIIEENKANHVYWEQEKWIYDVCKELPQFYELKGQERTARFIEELKKLSGVVVIEDDAGYELKIFTPYKVYLYRFNRGYGNHPITVTKSKTYGGSGWYYNRIFLAKSAQDMEDNHNNHSFKLVS